MAKLSGDDLHHPMLRSRCTQKLIISACGTASLALTGHGHRLLPAIYQTHPLQVSNVNAENQLKPHWKRQRSLSKARENPREP